MIFTNPLPAAVASGNGDKSDVSPLHSLSTRSRAQALKKRVKGECVCVCVCVKIVLCVNILLYAHTCRRKLICNWHTKK